jgi:hypothetical protein
VQHPDFYPTRANIFRAIQWLMTDLRFGDSLFFSFSGHGSQLRDPTGMEEDGMDETILPVDHQRAGQIRDTELHRAMAAPLPHGTVLHCLFDSCHSGTIMDLPYEVKYDQSGAAYWKGSRMYGTSGGTVFQLGACDDKQTAADTAAMSQSAYTGAATYSFIDSIERFGPDQTYANLLLHMTQSLRRLGKSSVSNPNGGAAMASMAAPMLGGVALGPAGLLVGALLGSVMDQQRMSHQLPVCGVLFCFVLFCFFWGGGGLIAVGRRVEALLQHTILRAAHTTSSLPQNNKRSCAATSRPTSTRSSSCSD